MLCSYCDRPLECAECRTEYEPPNQAYYEAISRPEVALICTKCNAPLVCYWCRVPYDGEAGEDS
jgi:hypothetical protein